MEVNIRVGTRAVNDPSVIIITGKAPTRAFGLLLVKSAIVGAFSVIVKTNGSFPALVVTYLTRMEVVPSVRQTAAALDTSTSTRHVR